MRRPLSYPGPLGPCQLPWGAGEGQLGEGGRAPQARSWAPPSPPAPARVSASRQDGEEPWAVLPHSLQSEAFWKRITPETSRLFHGLRASSDPLPVLWGHPQARPHPVPRALRSAHLGPPPPSALRAPVSLGAQQGPRPDPSTPSHHGLSGTSAAGCGLRRRPGRPRSVSLGARLGKEALGGRDSARPLFPAETWTARPASAWPPGCCRHSGRSQRVGDRSGPLPCWALSPGSAGSGSRRRVHPGVLPRSEGTPPHTASIFPPGAGQMR